MFLSLSEGPVATFLNVCTSDTDSVSSQRYRWSVNFVIQPHRVHIGISLTINITTFTIYSKKIFLSVNKTKAEPIVKQVFSLILKYIKCLKSLKNTLVSVLSFAKWLQLFSIIVLYYKWVLYTMFYIFTYIIYIQQQSLFMLYCIYKNTYL